MPDLLMVVALKTDQPDLKRRLELVLAVAAPTHQPPDTTACAIAKPVEDVTAAERAALDQLLGKDGAAGINLGPIVADGEPPLWGDLGVVGPVHFQGGVTFLRGFGCRRCGHGHWTEADHVRRHDPGAAVTCPHCDEPSVVPS